MKTRATLPTSAWAGGAALAAGIAVWDIWTHGQALIAIVMTGVAILLTSAGFVRRGRLRPLRGQGPLASRRGLRLYDQLTSLLSGVASSSGCGTVRALVFRSALGVAGLILIQRFVLYPSAAIAFDALIALATLAIVLLFATFIVRSRVQ